MDQNKSLTLTSSTTSLIKGEDVDLTPAKAWQGGTNIRAAIRQEPKKVRAYLLIELKKLVDFVDAKKTLKNEDELIFTIRTLIDEFPVMKVEEFALVFKWIKQGKFGKLYERLKTAEIVECVRKYEGDHRAQLLEEMHRERSQGGIPGERSSVANERYNREMRRGSLNLSNEDLLALGQVKKNNQNDEK